MTDAYDGRAPRRDIYWNDRAGSFTVNVDADTLGSVGSEADWSAAIVAGGSDPTSASLIDPTITVSGGGNAATFAWTDADAETLIGSGRSFHGLYTFTHDDGVTTYAAKGEFVLERNGTSNGATTATSLTLVNETVVLTAAAVVDAAAISESAARTAADGVLDDEISDLRAQPFVTTGIMDSELTAGIPIGSIILPPDVLANRPAAASVVPGALFIATDNNTIYRSTGAAWTVALDGSALTQASAFNINYGQPVVTQTTFATYAQSSGRWFGGSLSSTAQNALVVYALPATLVAGTWDLTFLCLSGTTLGIATIQTSPDASTWTTVTTFNCWAAVGGTPRLIQQGVTIGAGVKFVRIYVPTKDPSSTGYAIQFSQLSGARTGA